MIDLNDKQNDRKFNCVCHLIALLTFKKKKIV